MEKLFAVEEFEVKGPGRIEALGVVFEGDEADCEKFVNCKETLFTMEGNPCDIFFEIKEAI